MPNDPILQPGDVVLAANICRETLLPVAGADWSVPAGELDWTCRRTLDHVPDALIRYATHLATRATESRPNVRDGHPSQSPAELLEVVVLAASVLAEVARAAPPDARGFHPAGMADPSGFIGMGCTEILIHTDDISRGLGRGFQGPDDLSRRVLARIFPWAPADGAGWQTLRWAAGRAALPDQERLGADWYWHCAPLAEWDGTRKRRAAPPGWR